MVSGGWTNASLLFGWWVYAFFSLANFGFIDRLWAPVVSSEIYGFTGKNNFSLEWERKGLTGNSYGCKINSHALDLFWKIKWHPVIEIPMFLGKTIKKEK